MKYADLKTREGRHTFYSSPEWRSLRLIVLREHPFCSQCEREGRKYVEACEVHHIVDIVEDTTRCMDITNLEALCKSCHSKLTYVEHKSWKPVRFHNIQKKWKLLQ